MRATRRRLIHAALFAAPLLAVTAVGVLPASTAEPSLVNALAASFSRAVRRAPGRLGADAATARVRARQPGPADDGPLSWAARSTNYPVGPLEAGDVLTVTYQLTFSHPVAVLYPPVGPTGDDGP